MGRRSTVSGSPHEPEICELLTAGWSAERVREYLVAKYGDEQVPKARAILRYRQSHIPEQAVLPASMIQRAMRGLQYRVDTLKVLDNLIWAQEQRVARLWKEEQRETKGSPELDSALRTALEYLRERHRIAKELGVERPAGARLERHQSEVLELPEGELNELMAVLRRRREDDVDA